MLTYYQQTILASLIDYSYQAVEELREKYNVHLLIRWRRLIKRIEIIFELPMFHKALWDLSYSNPYCDKDEVPKIQIDSQKFELLRELVEFSKILVKTIKSSGDIYDVKNTIFRLVNEKLHYQFGFDYYEHCRRNPLSINISSYLKTNGLNELHINNEDVVWVFPHNINENESYYSSGIFTSEAEGLYYLGGEVLLSRILDYYRLNIYEVIQFQKKFKPL